MGQSILPIALYSFSLPLRWSETEISEILILLIYFPSLPHATYMNLKLMNPKFNNRGLDNETENSQEW